MSARRAQAVLALVAAAHLAGAIIDDAVEIIKFGKEIGEEVLNSWDLIGKPFNVSGGVELPIVRRRERQVLARLAQVTRAIERLELGIEKSNAISLLLAKSNGKGARLELRLVEIADLLSRVTSAERQMREYMKLQQELERSTLMDFAEWCVSHDRGALAGLLERIHSLIVPTHSHLLGRGLLRLMLDDLEEDHPELCELQLSQHQLIYDMYNTITLTEIKGYAMMQFSWMLLRIYGKGNFTQEANLTRQRYGERSARTAAAARAALSMARRDVYRCDPAHHIEGTTFEQVTRLLQGYIENEVDMNPEGTCRDNCAYYTLAKRHGCYKDQFCAKQQLCNGRIIDCQYIDSDMWVCPAAKGSSRRYEFIEYENGRTLGRAGSCARGTTKVDSWWRWLFWHCSYCMCLCDDATLSDRYFSLRDVTSDVENNKVVTGVSIKKLGKVFHLQISEGTLLERGAVAPGAWVAIQSFDPQDSDVREGIDYHTLTYERRAIDLDELDSPSGHVMTGIRFSVRGAHLNFGTRVTPFNYTTGRLYPEKSRWISNDNTEGAENPRTRLELFRPDVPTRSTAPLPVDSKHDQYVEFTNSDFDADAAQSTVPFIDIQPVQPMNGAGLMSGAGLIHRGARGSGGFIALKMIEYDKTHHVKAEAPPSSYDEDGETTEFLPIVN